MEKFVVLNLRNGSCFSAEFSLSSTCYTRWCKIRAFTLFSLARGCGKNFHLNLDIAVSKFPNLSFSFFRTQFAFFFVQWYFFNYETMRDFRLVEKFFPPKREGFCSRNSENKKEREEKHENQFLF